MKRAFLALSLVVAAASFPPAFAAGIAVELVNDNFLAVAVPLGADNGVTRESDFEIAMPDNSTVTIYPQEIFGNLFWSQTLPNEVYGKIKVGMPVRPVSLDNVTHRRIRNEGDAERADLRERQEDARRTVARKKIQDLREMKETLQEQRDSVDDSISAAEKDLAEEEGRMEWLIGSAEDDIDRALQRISEYADRRDDIQGQRDVLSRQQPYPRHEIDRLSTEIRNYNSRIDSERSTVRNARERKRMARSSYLSRKQEWQKLVSDRNALTNRIRSIETQIKDLAR